MWELCINVSDKNIQISKKIYLNLKQFCKDYGGIVTTYERFEKISVLVSANKCDGKRFEYYISNLISDIICEDFKLSFLKNNLSLPNLDEISKHAFIQALLSFDRESDKYIIQKYLHLDSSIDLEAFYFFKLAPLREKWKELVQVANDNKAYLSSNDTLVELLKFLVDNLEFKNETINLTFENGDVLFYDQNYKLLIKNTSDKNIDSTIISNLIALSPKYVNIYCGESFNANLIKLLKQIFDKRINLLTDENFLNRI